MLPAAIAAMSLALVGRAALGERLGRNARFAATRQRHRRRRDRRRRLLRLRSRRVLSHRGADAARHGRCSRWHAARRAAPPNGRRAGREPAGATGCACCCGWPRAGVRRMRGAVPPRQRRDAAAGRRRDHQDRSARQASLVIAACIVGCRSSWSPSPPPMSAALADRWGRRPVLAAHLPRRPAPRRAARPASPNRPAHLVAVQLLDGVSAAGFGVMLPLMAADLTRGTNRFNLCMGLFGLAAGLGATVSTARRRRSSPTVRQRDVALLGLAAAGLCLGAADPGRRCPRPGRRSRRSGVRLPSHRRWAIRRAPRLRRMPLASPRRWRRAHRHLGRRRPGQPRRHRLRPAAPTAPAQCSSPSSRADPGSRLLIAPGRPHPLRLADPCACSPAPRAAASPRSSPRCTSTTRPSSPASSRCASPPARSC